MPPGRARPARPPARHAARPRAAAPQRKHHQSEGRQRGALFISSFAFGYGCSAVSVVCTGSIAFDYILTFKGRFKDHILPDKTHMINLSFLVDDLKKRRGGVAGNYAYNLALLGYPSAVLATAGSDAVEYRAWLEQLGVDCRGLRLLEDEISATGFTTTDLDDNQITGYNRKSTRLNSSHT